jgi:hypothetical protein
VGPKPEARSPKPEARSPKPEARSPKPEAAGLRLGRPLCALSGVDLLL